MNFEVLLRRKGILFTMAVWACLLGCLPSSSSAMPVESRVSVIQGVNAREADIRTISSVLEKETIRQRLARLGLKEGEIKERLVRLDDAELHSLAMKVERIRAGGDSSLAIGIAILLLIIIAVLYFTDYAIKIEPRHESQ